MSDNSKAQDMAPTAALSQLVDEWNSRTKSLRLMGLIKEADALERCAEELAQRIIETCTHKMDVSASTEANTTSEKPQQLVSPCCKAIWLWEQMGGMRIYCEVDGAKHYSVRCGNCQRTYQIKDST